MITEEKDNNAESTVKKGYLAELRRRLAALPEEEKEAALTYYGEYFDDAGPEEAERVLNELGSPKSLAEQILSGYSRDYVDAGTPSYSTQVPVTPEAAAKSRQAEEEQKQKQAEQKSNKEQAHAGYTGKPARRSGASLLLIIVLVILALPLLIPIIASVFAVGVGLAAAVLGIAIAIAVTVLIMLVVGIIMLAAGISLLVMHTASALLACGVGLALLGAGILLAMLCGFICVKLIPALIRFTVYILRWPFNRRAVSA